ncbi:MAG: ion transporter [Chloroflexi bacterium]|nr:ion transporter [Chloroflexota bacterium]
MEPERKQTMFVDVGRATELPMLILAVLMVPLLLLPVAIDLSERANSTVLAVDWLIWAIFAVELGLKTYLAPSARAYLQHHWFDVLIVALPFLRPLRVMRAARTERAFRAARFGAMLLRTSETARMVLRRHGLHYSLAAMLVLVLVLSAAITFFERSHGGAIDDLGTAL